MLNGGYTENITIQGCWKNCCRYGCKDRRGGNKDIAYRKEEFKEHGRPYIVSRRDDLKCP